MNLFLDEKTKEEKFVDRIKLSKSTWYSMIYRCYRAKPGTRNYRHYVQRGITVCQAWHDSFEVFLSEMGERPGPKYSLDRIDNSKGYYKENCRWADGKTQGNKKTNSLRITHNGLSKTLTEWADTIGIKPETMFTRFYRGWSLGEIMMSSRGANITRNNKSKLDWAKVLTIHTFIKHPDYSRKKIAKIFNVSPQTIYNVRTEKEWGHIWMI